MPAPTWTVPARLLTLLAVVTLGVTLLAAPAVRDAVPAAAASGAEGKKAPEFRIATLNLENTMSPGEVAHDVRTLIGRGRPSVIGFQERGGSRPAMRAALPEHWALRMPIARSGSDLNPVAFNTRVWKPLGSWPRALATQTWQRSTGRTAIDQYGVVAALEHRNTGHQIRAVSFHLPSEIHNRRTGGPNYRQADRVGAFGRMADNLRELARNTPDRQQFVAMCDCNVNESRDTTDKLVRGQLTRPLGLENNYSAAGQRGGWQIDYVMAERREEFGIVDWRQLHDLRTDHPGVVTTLRRR